MRNAKRHPYADCETGVLMACAEKALRLVIAVLMLCSAALPASATGRVVNAAFKQATIDLLPHLQLVESPTPEVNIELPSDTADQKFVMPLKAGGPGPLHRWVVFTVANPELTARNLVLVVPHQSFVDSKVIWPRPVGSQIIGLQASTRQMASRLFVVGADAVALTVEPRATASYAIEISSGTIHKAGLWQRGAFDAQNSQYSFFRGVVLGIAMFLAIGFVCLFIVRPSAVFPSAGLFAWSAIGFIAFDAGYLAGGLPGLTETWTALHTRALIETMMLLGAILTLTTFVDLRSRSTVLRYVFIASALTSLGLLVYAWFAPDIASGIARMSFAAVVVVGFGLIVHYWLQGFVRAQVTLLPWSVLFVWTILAALTSLGVLENEFLSPALAAMLVLVLVTMGFSLAQFAFSHGVSSYHFLRDSGRRALALAGSEQAVWDWQVTDGSLFVGPELERALGLTPGTVGGADLRHWLELIHPADRAAYVGGVESAERRGRGSFSQEFRLRRADGSYRWYMLRARAMVGDDGTVMRLIGTLADITANKRSEDRLLSDAVRDRITGLPNKALFLDRLSRAAMRSRAGGNVDVYVIVVDLDHFKSINDGLGCEAGDSILSVTGRRLSQMLGPEDSAGRLPGDRFAIVFNGAHPPRDVIAFTETMRAALSEPVRLRNRDVQITVSIGVAHLRVDREHPEELLKDAEIALFEAKRRGRDMIEFFRSDMRTDTSELMALEQDLRRATERDEIEVFYQPIMRIADSGLAGFEALARWRHPQLGLLEPASFMGLAEETGIIRDIGRYVLNEAARQLGIWQRAFRPNDPLFLAVNVSSAQLLDFELVNDIKGLLAREDIRPGTLKLELTETLVMENPELSAKVLDRVKQMGIGLACDDFGTGYSALANLARLPFDTLKVDRTFLEADAEDERSAIVLDTIILLAHDLELTVVVEGVENQDQINRLLELECDYAQGFFIGEPITASQVLSALGGLPFGADGRRGGRNAFWELLRGERAPEPAPQPQRVASVEQPPLPEIPQPVPVEVALPERHQSDEEQQPQVSSDVENAAHAKGDAKPQSPGVPEEHIPSLQWPPPSSAAPVDQPEPIWPGDELGMTHDEGERESPVDIPDADEAAIELPAAPEPDETVTPETAADGIEAAEAEDAVPTPNVDLHVAGEPKPCKAEAIDDPADGEPEEQPEEAPVKKPAQKKPPESTSSSAGNQARPKKLATKPSTRSRKKAGQLKRKLRNAARTRKTKAK